MGDRILSGNRENRKYSNKNVIIIEDWELNPLAWKSIIGLIVFVIVNAAVTKAVSVSGLNDDGKFVFSSFISAVLSVPFLIYYIKIGTDMNVPGNLADGIELIIKKIRLSKTKEKIIISYKILFVMLIWAVGLFVPVMIDGRAYPAGGMFIYFLLIYTATVIVVLSSVESGSSENT